MIHRAAFALALMLPAAGCWGSDSLVLGTTTTVQDAGLLDVLVPAYEADSGFDMRAVVGGTGETLQKARRGDVHVLLTHSPARERALVDEGVGASRVPVMFNAFVLVGPPEDPAGLGAASGAVDAFRRLHDNGTLFASRADGSGTHDKELSLWDAAGLDPHGFDPAWYKQTGNGQAATLLYAAQTGAHMLIDAATLLHYHEQGLAQELVPLYRGDPLLRNQYAVTLLDASGPPHRADAFAQWITGPTGQAVIDAYELAGRRVFHPNAGEPGA